MPLGTQEEFNWGANANCYAYACNCTNPAVGVPPRTARPGIRAGIPLLNNADVAALMAGVLADGGASVIPMAGFPWLIPNPPVNHYLIAMLTSLTGFHFIRRDEVTKRWSWKDANHGSVKLNVLHLPSQRFVYINDSNLYDILVANRGHYMWMYSPMVFWAFFAVQNGGFDVAG